MSNVVILDYGDKALTCLVQNIEEQGYVPKVLRSPALEDVEDLAPHAIIITSCEDFDEGYETSRAVLKRFSPKISTLGIGVGFYHVAKTFGAQTYVSKDTHQGDDLVVYHEEVGMFENVLNPFKVTTDCPLALHPKMIPQDLVLTAFNAKYNDIVALTHRIFPLIAMQFRPETACHGMNQVLLRNFLSGQHLSSGRLTLKLAGLH